MKNSFHWGAELAVEEYQMTSIIASKIGTILHPKWNQTLFWKVSVRLKRSMVFGMYNLLGMGTAQFILRYCSKYLDGGGTSRSLSVQIIAVNATDLL